MMSRLHVPVLIFLFFAGAQSAGAQQIDSPYRFVETAQTINLFGGHFGPGAGVFDFGPRSTPIFGARYGIRFGGPFSGEADVLVLPSTRVVHDTASVGGELVVRGEAPLRIVAPMVAIRFNLTGARTWNRVQPYFLFGGGLAIDLSGGDATLEEDVTEDARYRFGTTFAGQLGAGADWFLTDRVSLRLDARNVLWKLRTPAAFRFTELGRDFPADEWKGNFVFTIGPAIHF